MASFPLVGFFMTTLGVDTYLQRGQPVLRQAVEEKRPPLLIANHPLLDVEHVVYPTYSVDSTHLLPGIWKR